ncbi:MAG TPA: helix-turn-helix transcriptional regulator [Terriglobales bacterium]|nr:helix-turn-helix transcriptional regulator [Terriglobales bacterium]
MATQTWLREQREGRGWTQQQAAARLHVTQAYLSMLESGRREWTARLLNRATEVFEPPVTVFPLPATVSASSASEAADALAGLGYPGFRHLAWGRRRTVKNPAEVLAAVLAMVTREARLVEALPWLVLTFGDLDWGWLERQAKLHDMQNRLGYVVMLARQLAERQGLDAEPRRLAQVEARLERSRLLAEDSLAGEGLTGAERRWLADRRPAAARHWNVLTDLTVEQLHHAT